MNAIILTEQQAAALTSARQPNAVRVLEPRRLQDGRLILNADVLDDPYFADPSQPWAAILAGEQVTVEEPQEVIEGAPGEIAVDGEAVAVDRFEQTRSAIVTLTEEELAERE